MRIAAQAAVVLVALLHFYFLVLEMFIWEKPYGLRTFGNTRERAAITKALAANQGLYNGFLAAGCRRRRGQSRSCSYSLREAGAGAGPLQVRAARSVSVVSVKERRAAV